MCLYELIMHLLCMEAESVEAPPTLLSDLLFSCTCYVVIIN
jgi:hypothetical protein